MKLFGLLAALACVAVSKAQPATRPDPVSPEVRAAAEAPALEWLKGNVVPFAVDVPTQAELKPLMESLQGARVIGFGEATHGDQQSQHFKTHAIRELVRLGQFDSLMLEVNRRPGAELDAYVNEGKGDLAQLMLESGIFSIWRTDEFASLIVWLRAYVTRTGKSIRIYGIDCQEPGLDFKFALDWLEKADKETVAEKGFYILPSELFENVRRRAAKDENLNETLERTFNNIEGSAVGSDSEDDLKGLFDDLDVNSQKLGATVARRNEKLVKLLDAIGDLPLGNYEDNSIDLFGDAYEFLMTMYASQAGKSGGEFFTPQEVSELLARITVVGKSQVNKVYDPAVGSGSLLLHFAKVLGKENVRQGFYGQEINLTTYNLARINMFLHDVNYEKFHIAHGDTLLDPQHWDDEPFEAIVSNPPYSIKWDGDANPLLINDPRFAPAGVLAPKSKVDLAFTMHMLSWLAVNGTAAIVEYPGVLYRGGAEQKIRKYLIDNNYIDTVIQLPPDLFFGTPIATCIIILKKSKKDNSILFIDASAEFTRSGNKNKLMPAHQQKILDAFTARESVEHFCRLVPSAEIAENFNISVSSYVEKEDTSVAIDIKALNQQIAEIVKRQSELRTQIDAIVADLEGSTA